MINTEMCRWQLESLRLDTQQTSIHPLLALIEADTGRLCLQNRQETLLSELREIIQALANLTSMAVYWLIYRHVNNFGHWEPDLCINAKPCLYMADYTCV